MSDYIQDQEYSMQLAAPDDDPSTYDWARLHEEVDQHQPMSVHVSPFADITLASLQENIDVDACDWSGLNEDLENGPWRDCFGPNADCQGVEAQPCDRKQSQPCPIMIEEPPTNEVLEAIHLLDNATKAFTPFTCDYPKCGSKAFRRKGDLTRHQKLHRRERRFPCTAQECRFSFTRKDKLVDHIRAGHDDSTLFACPSTSCQVLLTRDVLPLHLVEDRRRGFSFMNNYRQCPLPKCSFRTRVSELDELQQHLLKGHDLKGKKRFAILLASRGYDYESANIVCPICDDTNDFETHEGFEYHFLVTHCPHPDMLPEQKALSIEHPWKHLKTCEIIPDEVRKHRRAILSVVPVFRWHPVWSDMEKCPS